MNGIEYSSPIRKRTINMISSIPVQYKVIIPWNNMQQKSLIISVYETAKNKYSSTFLGMVYIPIVEIYPETVYLDTFQLLQKYENTDKVKEILPYSIQMKIIRTDSIIDWIYDDTDKNIPISIDTKFSATKLVNGFRRLSRIIDSLNYEFWRRMYSD